MPVRPAPVHPGAFRGANWLIKHRYGANVYVFRNLESGQVLYTQTPYPQEYNRSEQFQYASLENRLPKLRRDLWRAMTVVELPTHEKAVEFYEDLVQLRNMRDRTQKHQADLWRKKDADGRVWSWGQYRPTYTQEAVADLLSAAEAAETDVHLHWEDAWRKGDDKHWQAVNVTHHVMKSCKPEQRFVILRDLASKSFKNAMALREDGSAEQINASSISSETESTDTTTAESEDPVSTEGAASAREVSQKAASEQAQLIEFRKQQVQTAKEALAKAQEALENAQKSGSASLKQSTRKNVKSKTKAVRRAERQLQIDSNNHTV